jgi:hypothetical protein
LQGETTEETQTDKQDEYKSEERIKFEEVFNRTFGKALHELNELAEEISGSSQDDMLEKVKLRGSFLARASFNDVDNAMAMFSLRSKLLNESISYLFGAVMASPIAGISLLKDIKDQAYAVSASATSLQRVLIKAANEFRAENGEDPIDESPVLERIMY